MDFELTPYVENAIANMPEQWRTTFTAWLLNLRSHNTRRAYIRCWERFLAVLNVTPLDVTQDHIIAFKEMMENTVSDFTGRPLTNETINQHLSAISSFYSFAKERRIIDDNPVSGVRFEPVNVYGKSYPLDIDNGEDKALLATCDRSTTEGKRDYAILLLFLTTGVRLDVVANLRMNSFEKRGSATYLVFTRKGGKQQSIRLPQIVIEAIQDYLDGCNIRQYDDPVFSINPPAPISKSSIRRIISRRAYQAFGDGHGVTPHTLRHTAASIGETLGTISAVSNLLGHESTNTTHVYLHATSRHGDDLAERIASRYDEGI